MDEAGAGRLMDQGTLATWVESGEAPDWVGNHWRTFNESLLGERTEDRFPCFFGTESVRDGEPLYTVVPSTTDTDALLDLGRVLLEYLEAWPDHGDRASLVAFFHPPDRELSEAEYHEALWHILQFLHVHDPEPWSESIPTEPDDPRWEFSFGGDPMFPTCRTPFYDERRSRYCPVGLEITFQPRALFEGLDVIADTEAGQRARGIIQDRLEEYDSVCPHADLGDWGVEGDREWVQYMLSVDDDQFPETCPITVTREHPKSDRLRSEASADEPDGEATDPSRAR